MIGIQTSIWSNRLKTLYLIILMPVIVCLAIILGMLIAYEGNVDLALQDGFIGTILSLPVIAIWFFIAVFFQKKIIFAFSGAKEITRQSHPEIYNIVENLCMSRGLPIPKIGILEDDSLNAFATGWSPKKSWIVFSRGILNKLDKKELEAVAGHELTHIMNGDIKVMVMATVFVGIVATVGEILLRSGGNSRNSNGKGNPLPLIGLFLYLAGILILPLINLAISRKREFLADAGAVQLTSDKYAMISALEKISQDSVVESISKQSVAQMCIANPFAKVGGKIKKLLSTHPPIEERIAALQQY